MANFSNPRLKNVRSKNEVPVSHTDRMVGVQEQFLIQESVRKRALPQETYPVSTVETPMSIDYFQLNGDNAKIDSKKDSHTDRMINVQEQYSNQESGETPFGRLALPQTNPLSTNGNLRNESTGFEGNSIFEFGETFCLFFQKKQYIPVTSNSEPITSNQLQIQCGKKIGSGAFASVYEGWLRVDNKDAPVAIRMMKQSEDLNEKRQTMSNYHNLRKLLVHECPFLVMPDIILTSEKYFVSIMQCEVTSLDAYIEKKRQEHCWNDNCSKSIHLQCDKLSPQHVFVWLTQIANGTKFLHNNGYIHGDMKPANVLMTCNGTLKICDLDSVKVLNDGSASTHVTGTPGYADPDIFRRGMSFTSDVYSLVTFIPATFGLCDMYLKMKKGDPNYWASLCRRTKERNGKLCKEMENLDHLFPFSQLFKEVVKSTGDDKPNITQLVKLFTEHKQFERFRTSTQPCVTDHLRPG